MYIEQDEILNNLSERLAFILKKMNITQAELARLIDVKPQVIHYLCNSASKKSGFTYEIAKALQINSLWLACGTGPIKDTDSDSSLMDSQQRIPILNWRQLQNWFITKAEITDIKEWILVGSHLNNDSFGFKLQDNSLFPRFEKDTTIIINPSISARPNDFVLVFLAETQDIICRQYDSKKNRILLKPLNTELYKAIEKKPDDIILGVIVEARWQFRS